MIYRSPLHIFGDRNLKQLDPASLKKLRQEYLLKFDLSGETTIKINDQEFDKAGVIQLFEGLKTDGERHLAVFKNKPLLNFLEEGKLGFFNTSMAWREFRDDHFSNWITPYLSHQLSSVVYRLSTTESFGSMRQLEALQQSAFPFPPGLKYTAFSKTFEYYDQWLDEAQELMLEPFIEHSYKGKFKSEVINVFAGIKFSTLKALPEDIFQPLRAKYARVATQALTKAFYKERKFDEFGRPTLLALEQACRIFIEDDPSDKDIKQILKDLTSYLRYGNSKGGGDSGGMSTWAVVRIVLFLAIVLFRMATCSNNNSSSTTYDARKLGNEQLRQRFNESRRTKSLQSVWKADFKIGKDSIPVTWTLDLQAYGRAEIEAMVFDKEAKVICHYNNVAKWLNFNNARSGLKIKGNLLRFEYNQGEFVQECEDSNRQIKSAINEFEDILKVDDFFCKFDEPGLGRSVKALKIGKIIFTRSR